MTNRQAKSGEYNSPQDPIRLTLEYSKSISDHLSSPNTAVDLEMAVLGAMLLEGSAIDRVAEFLKVESFSRAEHQIIYETMLDMWRDGKPIDILTVANRLKSKGKLTAVGGHAYLAKLTQKIGSAGHVVHHARIVHQKYLANKFVQAGMRIAMMAADKDADILDVISMSNRILDEANLESVKRGHAREVGIIAGESLKEAEERCAKAKEGGVVGISTGIVRLDRELHGLQSLLYILAARPAMGKTAVSLHLTLAASSQGKHVCYYSLEMSDTRLVDRLLIALSGVDAHAYRSGRLSDSDWQKLNKTQGMLNTMNIYIDPNPKVSMDYIAAHSRMMKNQGRCDMIVVDYLQLMDMSAGRTRTEEVGKQTRRAKQITKDMNVPLVLLSQLSRAVELRGGKRPQLSDLRDSGEIEQDADVVMFLHREAYYDRATTEIDGLGEVTTEGLLELIIAKQRDGMVGTIPVYHNPSFTYFDDWSMAIHGSPTFDRANITTEDNLPF